MNFVKRAWKALNYWYPSIKSRVLGPLSFSAAVPSLLTMSRNSDALVTKNKGVDLSSITFESLSEDALSAAKLQATVVSSLSDQ